MRTRRLRFPAVALAAVLLAAACGGDGGDEVAGVAIEVSETVHVEGEPLTDEVPTPTGTPTDRGNVDGTLRLGSVLPSTGDLAVLGDPMNEAVNMAIRDINDAGGVLGGDVELAARDSGTLEDVANSAVDELLGAERVDAIIGAASSRISLSVIDKITGAGVVQCSPSNTGLDFTTYEDNGFYFRTAPPDNLQARVLVDELVAPAGHGSVAIMALADSYGQGFANSLESELEASGIDVPANVAYDPRGTEFDNDVEQLVEADPDAIAMIAFPDTGSTIIQTMIEQGIGPEDTPLYVTDGLQSSQLGELVDPDDPGVVLGVQGTAPSAAPPTGEPSFAEDFAEFAPGVDTIFSAHAYDCAVVIALATVAAGSDDPLAIQGQMNDVTRGGEECNSFADCKELLEGGADIDYQGASGALDFVPAGEPGAGDYDIWEFVEAEAEADEE